MIIFWISADLRVNEVADGARDVALAPLGASGQRVVSGASADMSLACPTL
jgi:hypothetical protein